MAFTPDIHDRAYQFFIEEVPELLQAIEDGILMLRQDRSANVVHEVMRAAHSIKGGSASVELDAIKEISHRLETAFRALYDESVEIDVELETLLLQGYDCLQQPLNEQMETGSHDPEQSLAKAIPVLEAIEAKLGAEALSQADSFIPSSSDLGVDMVTSIFEIDVEQGIARLEEVAANPSAFPVAGELQAQAEVFTGFGELLELPGFGAIAQAISQAVAQAPERAEEILMVALPDLTAARDLVMGGDRDQGGSPSEALLALAAGGATHASATDSATATGDMVDGWNDMEDFSLTDAFGGEADVFSLDMDAAALQDLLGGPALSEPDAPTDSPSPAVAAEAPVPTNSEATPAESSPLDLGEAPDFSLDAIAFPDEPIFPAEPISTHSAEPASLSSKIEDAVEKAESSEVASEAASETEKSVEDPWVLPTEEIPIEEVLAAVQAHTAPSETLDNIKENETHKNESSISNEPGTIDEPAISKPAINKPAVSESAISDPAATRESMDGLATGAGSAAVEASAPTPQNFDEATAAGHLADLFGLDPEAVSSPEQTAPDATSPEKSEEAASEDNAVSALFGLEADDDMSPEADIFSQVEWQADESLVEKAETNPSDAEPSVTEPSISAVTEAMAVEGAIADIPTPASSPAEPEPANPTSEMLPETNDSSTETSEDLANLLEIFDLGTESGNTTTAEVATEQSNTTSNVAGGEVTAQSPEESIPDGTFVQMEATAESPASAPMADIAKAIAKPPLAETDSAASATPSATELSPPITDTSLTAGIDELFDEGTFIQPEAKQATVVQGDQGGMTNAAVEVALAELQATQPGSTPETPVAKASPASSAVIPPAATTPAATTPSLASPTPPLSPKPPAENSVEQQASPSAAVQSIPQEPVSPQPVSPQPVSPQPVASPSLDAAVQAVEQLFEQLPANAPLPEPIAKPQAVKPAAAEPAKAKKKEEKKRKAAPLSGISVRVDLSVLERMNNLVGELVLNRNSLSLQNEQLQAVVGQLAKRFKNFEGILASLREVSDQMLVKPNQPSASPTSNVLQGESSEPNSLTDGFDSLEMDRYSALHTQLQEIFEELMQLEEGVDDIDVLLEQSTQSISQQRQGLSRLQNELMWARMLPLDNILSRFPRVLRDLAAKHGKAVDLKLDGTSVLVDKGILEKLHDPMLHLLRNAFDHGIEPPEARQQQGKDERGTIAIRAFYQGNQTVIEIKDDGRGLSLEKIARRAVELGWMTREELKTIPQQVIADLIFEPGFSTASEVSELSGRGVGLDVVREQLKSLKGNVSVSSAPGEGTKFSLKLPLTLSVAKLMVCQVGPLALALPSDAIEDLLVPEPKRIKTVANQRFLHWHDDLIPIHPMSELLDYSCPLPDATSLKNLTDATIPVPQEWAMPILIFKQGEQFFALEVNRLLMEQELVIKPFGSAAHAPEYAYGCTILGDGQMIPVFDASSLLGSLTQESKSFNGTGINIGDEPIAAAPAAPSMSSVGSARMSKTILVVDDSTAMRRTLALSLEKAGYRILQAGDGQEAIEQLRQSSTIQLVICDVEMPTMNGFEFLSQRRREPELLKTPVVMLTSRSSDKHRRLALQLNANGYFSKPYVEQEFLKSIRGILDESPTAATV